MKEKCKETCEQCNGDEDDGGDDEECVDEKSSRWCRRVKRFCTFSQRIQDACKQTCGMCGDEDDDTTECSD